MFDELPLCCAHERAPLLCSCCTWSWLRRPVILAVERRPVRAPERNGAGAVTPYVLMAAAESDRIGLRTYIESWLRGRGAAPQTNMRFFSDSTGTVFLRVEFTANQEVTTLRAEFQTISAQWALKTWTIESLRRPRILVLTGRDDQCMFELLSRNRHEGEPATSSRSPPATGTCAGSPKHTACPSPISRGRTASNLSNLDRLLQR